MQVEKEERAKLEAEQQAATQQDQWAGLGPSTTEGLPQEPADVCSVYVGVGVCMCVRVCACVCACAHAHTSASHRFYFENSPGTNLRS